MLNNGCEAGCKAYTGGEIRHHKDCQYYPESFTKMYDDLKAENASLKNQVDNLKTEIIISKNKNY